VNAITSSRSIWDPGQIAGEITWSALRYGDPVPSVSPARAPAASTPITTTNATEAITAIAAATYRRAWMRSEARNTVRIRRSARPAS
jgi:hypothetical protein